MTVTVSPSTKSLVSSQFSVDEAASPREGKDILEMIAAQAARSPNSIALICDGDAVTYQELERKASQLGNYLRAIGVGPEDLIGIYINRSITMMIGILGVLKSGGAYVPLDPSYPRERLLSILDDAQVKYILSRSNLLGSLPEVETRMICLDKAWAEIFNQPETIEGVQASPESLVYVMYTSGSTGKPKGVMITHANLSNFVCNVRSALPIYPEDICLHTASISYALGVRQLMVPLACGVPIVIATSEQARDPILLFDLIKQHKVTLMDFVPSFWRTCIQRLSALPPEDRRSLLDNHLRRIVSIGEALLYDIPNKWRVEFGHPAELINLFGQTETTGIVAAFPIPRDQEGSSGIVPIGRALPNTELFILDSNRQPVSPGMSGELCIKNLCIGRGYLNKPELTNEKFVPNPFSENPGDRIYRTGDLARCREDGNIEFLGREDDQVKIRGQRLELGDVEAALCEHANVKEAAVIAREDDSGEKYLQACVVPLVYSKALAGELASYMRQKVPAYMVPSNFVFLESLPLTPNGKTDRRALRENVIASSLKGGEVHAMIPIRMGQGDLQGEPVFPCVEGSPDQPRNGLETKILSIWQDLLQVQSIGIRDNFFELGGHSVLAARMFAQIRQEFGVDLPLATLFRDATIEYLADLITGKSKPVTWSSLIEIEPQGSHAPFYCVHGLTGDILWFRELAHLFAPDYPFYGLQSRGLDGIEAPLSWVEEMAALYIEEIRRLQPSGPYYLGGASFGGTISLEIAQQLLAQGEEVAVLAIFDHTPHNVEEPSDDSSWKNRLASGYRILKNFPHWLKGFLQMGPQRMFLRIRRKLRLAGKTKQQAVANPTGQFDAEDIIDFAGGLDAHRQQLIQSNYQALKSYVPKPYAGRVTLFRAQNRPLWSTKDPETPWQILAPGRVDVHDIPSSHEGMFKSPHVQDLAQKLKLAIEQADQARATHRLESMSG